ncbi:MAG: glycosyltransferase family 4 protein [Fimbriimonadales bacterium]
MRALLLTRQLRPSWASYVDRLAVMMTRFGVQATVEDATSWIPNETGPRVDREVSIHLKRVAEDYDVVHAFGYRAAWACAEAFGSQEAWLFSAIDFPKTTHPQLVERLNKAQRAFCVSEAVRIPLATAGVELARVYRPGVRPPLDLVDRDTARVPFDIPETAQVVAGLGRMVPERGFMKLMLAMEEVWRADPEVYLLLAGTGPEEEAIRAHRWEMSQPDKVRAVGPVSAPWDTYRAADLVVVPSGSTSFSFVAAEAMAAKRPVLVRDEAGLREMVEPHLSGFTFADDSVLASQILEALSMPYTMDAVAQGAEARYHERFDLEKNADALAAVHLSLRS